VLADASEPIGDLSLSHDLESEPLPETLSGMVGMHRDLLDMGVSIDHVDEEVGHGMIRVVGDDPGATVFLGRRPAL